MDEIARTERASDNGWYPFAVRRLHAYLIADVRENLIVAQRYQRQFAEVGMCREVFQGMELIYF